MMHAKQQRTKLTSRCWQIHHPVQSKRDGMKIESSGRRRGWSQNTVSSLSSRQVWVFLSGDLNVNFLTDRKPVLSSMQERSPFFFQFHFHKLPWPACGLGSMTYISKLRLLLTWLCPKLLKARLTVLRVGAEMATCHLCTRAGMVNCGLCWNRDDKMRFVLEQGSQSKLVS